MSGRKKKDDISNEEVIARVEPSTMQLPLFAPTNHIYEDRIYEKIKHKGDQTITQRVKVGYSVRGTLSVFDQIVLFSLIYLWEKSGAQENSVRTSLHELARLTKIGWGKKQLDKLVDSLNRLYEISIDFENLLVDKKANVNLGSQDRFRFVNSFNLQTLSEHQSQKIRAGSSTVEINSLIINNLRANYSRPVLLNVLVGFPSHHLRAAYLFFDRVTCNPGKTYSATAKNLLESLAISTDRFSKLSNRKAFLQNLVSHLQDVSVWRGHLKMKAEPTKDGKDWKVTVTCIERPSGSKEQEVQSLAIYREDETLPENRPNLIQAPVFTQKFLEAFNITRKPQAKEINAMQFEISKFGITPEMVEYILGYAVKECRRTNFRPRYAQAIKPYIEIAISKLLSDKPKEDTTEKSSDTLSRQPISREKLEWIAQELWQLMSPDEQKRKIKEKQNSLLNNPEKRHLLDGCDETTVENMLLHSILDDLTENEAHRFTEIF